jgi:hypothetical protein
MQHERLGFAKKFICSCSSQLLKICKSLINKVKCYKKFRTKCSQHGGVRLIVNKKIKLINICPKLAFKNKKNNKANQQWIYKRVQSLKKFWCKSKCYLIPKVGIVKIYVIFNKHHKICI